MPKVRYTASKGLFQESGSGVALVDPSGVTMRRKVIAWTADKTLTSADSGALVFCTQTSTAIDLEIPTAAAAGSGWFVDVILKTASTAAANIDTQADSSLVFIHCADGGTDSAADTVETKRTISFSADATVNSRINIVSDGSVYFVRGFTGTTAEIAIADTGV